MPDETLEEIIARMSPKALDMYKEDFLLRAKDMSPSALTRYKSIPQLGDLFTQPEVRAGVTRRPEDERPWDIITEPDVPLWQRTLGAVTLPFALAQEYIVDPFATAVTSPWSGADWDLTNLGSLMPGGEAKRAYEEWEAPRFLKGALEFLPWLLVPPAGKIMGMAGMAGMTRSKAWPLTWASTRRS